MCCSVTYSTPLGIFSSFTTFCPYISFIIVQNANTPSMLRDELFFLLYVVKDIARFNVIVAVFFFSFLVFLLLYVVGTECLCVCVCVSYRIYSNERIIIIIIMFIYIKHSAYVFGMRTQTTKWTQSVRVWEHYNILLFVLQGGWNIKHPFTRLRTVLPRCCCCCCCVRACMLYSLWHYK